MVHSSDSKPYRKRFPGELKTTRKSIVYIRHWPVHLTLSFLLCNQVAIQWSIGLRLLLLELRNLLSCLLMLRNYSYVIHTLLRNKQLCKPFISPHAKMFRCSISVYIYLVLSRLTFVTPITLSILRNKCYVIHLA